MSQPRPFLAWIERLPFSREGKLWLLIALAMLATGLMKSINLLTLLACFLLMTAGLNFLLARRQLRSLRAKRQVAGPAFAGTPWPCQIRVENLGSRSAEGVRLQAGTQRWFFPHLAAGAPLLLPQEITFPRRGRTGTETLRFVSGYPLGLAQVERPQEAGETLVVLPRIGSLQRGQLLAQLRAQGRTEGRNQPPRSSAAAQILFHGLRPYRPGDSLRSIHWRTSARHNELMVREFDDPPADDLTVVVDAAPPDLERVISLAATVCWEWCRQTGDRLTLVVVGAETTVLTGVTGRPLALLMLECLAVEPGAAERNPGLLHAEVLPVGPTLLIGSDPVALARLQTQLPGQATTLLAGSDLEQMLFQI